MVEGGSERYAADFIKRQSAVHRIVGIQRSDGGSGLAR